MDRVFVTGDTHGLIDFDKIQTAVETLSLDKSDYIVITGDFGFTMYHSYKEYIKKYIEPIPCTILFIDGNHENFNILNKLKKVQMFGGKVGKLADNCYHLRRGEVYTILDKTYFTFGGASSIDKAHRTLGLDYFTEELPSYKDMSNGLKTLKKLKDNGIKEVDYVIAHICPSFIFKEVCKELRFHIESEDYQLMCYFENLPIKYKKWFFRHYHLDRSYGDSFYCVFNNLIQVN